MNENESNLSNSSIKVAKFERTPSFNYRKPENRTSEEAPTKKKSNVPRKEAVLKSQPAPGRGTVSSRTHEIGTHNIVTP